MIESEDEAHSTTMSDFEPTTYQEMISCPDARLWMEGVNSEMKSLEDNNTFTVVPIPKGRKIVGSKLVFKLKRDEQGNITRHKVRCVAQGFSQVQGIDYNETFSPTVRWATVRSFLTYAEHERKKYKEGDYLLVQLDVATAFLIPKLPQDEEIYMRAPPGVKLKEGYCYKLNKSIYGLKQAGRKWYEELQGSLFENGFKQATADPCLYLKYDNNKVVCACLTYVEDILVACNKEEVSKVIHNLENKYKMTNSGFPTHFLGVKIERVRDGLRLSQPAYIDKIAERFNMTNAKPCATPACADRLVKANAQSEEEKRDMKDVPYRELVGALMYASVATRPDIAYAVSQVSRFLNEPAQQHWTAAKRVLRYLIGTKDLGIIIKNDKELLLRGWSDADWAGDVEDRRSTTGYLFTLAGAPVAWKSKKQPTVALSSCESELMAITESVKEALWLRKLMADLRIDGAPTTIFEDNQGCIAIANDAKWSARTKHIATRYFRVQEEVHAKTVKVVYATTQDMLADLLTKPVGRLIFERLLKVIFCL